MKIIFPGIQNVFKTDIESVNSLIIENPKLFYRLLTDMQEQMEGSEGKTVVSDQDIVLPFSKNVEILSQFFSFNLSKKNLITKATIAMEKRALQDAFVPT